MSWIRWLSGGLRLHERRPSLRPRDCPSCWRARAYAARWGKTECSGCGKVHGARRWRFSGIQA